MDEIKKLLSALKLLGMSETIENRIEQARESDWSIQECLLILLQDECQYRQAKGLARRIRDAKFEEEKVFENLDLKRYSEKIRKSIRDLKSGGYLKQHQHVILLGLTGTGKTHLAQALGHEACRNGYSVCFIRASRLFRAFKASRADHRWERTLQRFSKYDLLIIDDFGLSALDSIQTEDLYELIAERCLKKSMVFTSNRKVESWVDLFSDPVMGNAALDRVSSGAHHVLLDGPSSRRKRE